MCKFRIYNLVRLTAIVAGLGMLLPAMAGPSVTVENAVTLNPATPNPVTVSNLPAVENPFQRFVGNFVGTFVDFGTVPAGQRWIIRHVSVRFDCVNAQVTSMDLRKSIGNQVVIDFLVPQPNGTNIVAANSQTVFIADPGEDVLANVSGVGSGSCATFAFISGVIVPSP